MYIEMYTWFNRLEKNTEKYKTFSVPVTKEVKRIGKTGE